MPLALSIAKAWPEAVRVEDSRPAYDTDDLGGVFGISTGDELAETFPLSGQRVF